MTSKTQALLTALKWLDSRCFDWQVRLQLLDAALQACSGDGTLYLEVLKRTELRLRNQMQCYLLSSWQCYGVLAL